MVVKGNVKVVLGRHFAQEFDLGHFEAALLTLDVFDGFDLWEDQSKIR